MVDDRAELAANRTNWDERVPTHLREYGVETFIDDPNQISSVVAEDLRLMRPHLPPSGPAGLSLVHLQCHIGLDTLSWARLGATVTGIDFSPAAITAARDIARRAQLPATFIEGEIGAALNACADQFDVVYTGIGALPWLPDLAQWAQLIAALLHPGGLFYVRDSHPILHAIDYDHDDALILTGSYFATGKPIRYDHGTTYANDHTRLTNATTYEWPHSLSEIIQSLLDAGLILTSLAEHRTIPWPALRHLVSTPSGWQLPEPSDRAPLTFSLTATKPRGGVLRVRGRLNVAGLRQPEHGACPADHAGVHQRIRRRERNGVSTSTSSRSSKPTPT